MKTIGRRSNQFVSLLSVLQYLFSVGMGRYSLLFSVAQNSLATGNWIVSHGIDGIADSVDVRGIFFFGCLCDMNQMAPNQRPHLTERRRFDQFRSAVHASFPADDPVEGADVAAPKREAFSQPRPGVVRVLHYQRNHFLAFHILLSIDCVGRDFSCWVDREREWKCNLLFRNGSIWAAYERLSVAVGWKV